MKGFFETAGRVIAFVFGGAIVKVIALGARFGGFVAGIVGVLARLGGPVAAVAGVFIRAFGSVRDAVSGAISWVKDRFTGLITFVGGVPGKIAHAASGLFDGIKNAFRSAINFIIRGWNSLRFGIPEINTHIPGIGKIGGGSFGVPYIPELAKGGIVTGPGSWITGEAGPELNTRTANGAVHVRPLSRASTPSTPAVAQGSLRSAMPDVISNIKLVVDGRELAAIVNRQRLRAAEAA